ncbi:FecR family protein [Pedobacter sp. MR2016-24]|uniref:FecR family protein n=1 Tax=Pedobacter sp. MR2016-24 TaxID=2994466 RepID=UPI002247EB8D|nr:FecR domain-containing protein [Pedobacter sp. MR2016-24]MCX2485759.1 DUF4974 domain-containing protein [Pedobacter sp. MR2016-24]
MDKSLIIALLSKKMAAEATQEELEQLRLLMEKYPDAIYYEEFLQELWENNSGGQVPQSDLAQIYASHRQKYKNDFTSNPAEEIYVDTHTSLRLSGILLGIVVLALLCFGLWQKNDQLPDHPTHIVSGKGIRKKVVLPDGTLVWLNAGSKLSYDTGFNQQKIRQVFLTGEAFFDVAHRKSQPFIVHTEKISVKVLGTAFNIQAYPGEQKSEATLIRGSIELSVNDQSGQKITLNPSEKFAFSTEKKTMVINHVEPVKIGNDEYIEETSWKDNQLVFQNETLEDLKPRLERWFNIQISIRSEQPKHYRFTGVFKNETINEALVAMQLIKPFTFKLTRYDVIIY